MRGTIYICIYFSALISRGYDILRQLACRIHLGCLDEVLWFEINKSPRAGVLTVGKDLKTVPNKSNILQASHVVLREL